MVERNRIKSADIARMAGVSRATVSYVINNRSDQNISLETRQRVLDAIELSGYRPNSVARALVSGKTKTVALWIPIVSRSVSGQYIKHIGQLAKDDGYHVVVVEIADETPDSMSQAGLLDHGRFDGILAVDATGLVESLLPRFKNLPPIITMGPAYSKNTDFVGVDLAGGSKQAMDHLVKCGCERIAFLVHELHAYPGDPRFDAYAVKVMQLDRKLDVVTVKLPRLLDAYRAVVERFKHDEKPDALFCFNDECAIAANKALKDSGLSVPFDVALIGNDGIDETKYTIPGISTVAQPYEEICTLAWSRLLHRFAEPNDAVSGTVLPMNLIVRPSTTAIANL